MGLLDKLLARAAPVPPWAGFFTAEEYARFVALLCPALEKHGLPSDPAALSAGVLPAKIGTTESALGLGPIARRCNGLAPDRWAPTIAEHIDRALESHEQTITRLAGDFEAARPFLKVQLMSEGARRPDWEEGLNYRRFAPGVLAVLNYDLPTVVHSVPAADVRGWGLPLPELLEVATENVRQDPTPVDRESLVFAGTRVEQLSGDGYFVCSHALWLDEQRDHAAGRGLLLAVPSRHLVLFKAIDGPGALAAIEPLSQLAHRLYATVPGPVSSEVFWLRGDSAVHIPVLRTEDAAQVLVPPELSALLAEP